MALTPFTSDEFLRVFVIYNAAIWPAQVVGYLLGLMAVGAVFSRGALATRLAFTALAGMWLWNGLVYHLLFFSVINPAAIVFAGLFALQGVVLLASAASPAAVRFELRSDTRTAFGLAALGYALAVYPLLGILAGHGLMAGPAFAVTPCPTTIFTIGLLLLARGKWLRWISAIPILWSLVGLAAVLQLGILEDAGLPVSGALLLIFLFTPATGSAPSQP